MKNQRKDGRFQKWVTIGKGEDGKPVRKTVYGDTAEELQQKAAALKQDAALGKVGANTPTFSSMAEGWLNRLSQEKSKSTITGYRSYIQRFLLPALGEEPMAAVTAEDIARVLEKALAENCSRSSAMQKRAAFATQNLRLTYAQMLFERGLNVMEVKYLLGLSTLEAAMKLAERFLKVDGERMKESLCGLCA